MKTKKCRPVLVENRFNSLEEMNGDLIIRNGILYTHATIPSLKKHETDRVFELILISLEDEKIENGDVCYDELNNAVNVYKSYPNKNSYNAKKVIATQNQLSPEYIAKFVEQYNRIREYHENYCECNIDDIEIEMEEFCDEQTIASASGFSLKVPINIEYKPKLTNRFVTIVNKEPILYTEEETRILCEKSMHQGSLNEGCTALYKCFEDWFEQNKKK